MKKTGKLIYTYSETILGLGEDSILECPVIVSPAEPRRDELGGRTRS